MKIDEYIKAETTNIDYKLKLENIKPKSWLKSISAFANTKGGFLLFGVEDKTHEKVGITNVDTVCEKISELINDRIKPIPRYEIEIISEDDKDFIKVQVGDGPNTPYYLVSDGNKEAFIRSGNQSISAPEYALNTLILKGQNTTYDSQPSKYKKEDLSFTLLSATLREETGKELEDRDFVSLKLCDSNDVLSNAGALLSDQGPLTQSKVVCTRWNGLIKGSVEKDAIDDKEYTGSLISILENTDTFIKNNSKSGWKIEGMSRIELEDYPVEARREAIVNALIHRDYQMLGSEVHIDMYDDRMEIVSPGGMCDGSFIQNLNINKVPSLRRNIVISDIFSRLHYMDRRGSGIGRIIDKYEDSSIKPIFTSDDSSFTVIFPNKGYKPEETINKNTNNNENVVSDDDYFLIMIYKKFGDRTNRKTFSQVQLLYKNFKYTNSFNKNNIMELLHIKESRCNDFTKELLDKGIIKKIDNKNYVFKK